MGIETIGNAAGRLNEFDAKGWASSSKIKLEGLGPTSVGDIPGAAKNKSFSEMLTDSIADVNSMQEDANKAIQRLVTGESKNLHETMLAVEKAEIAFKTMNQIRTKVIEAYKDIMRMQI
ncbi:MAG: flagellar hook-basal body complex protein FliE [Bdellovibrio sp. CG12_big_fil_rev_8_21_14_0_65_39_13]|nr:MAG: flagellar hook-basal body complex protein FliE [Bdellovibrio sp. CG22_combo_CG10-13_8_21_14_all_39_27]PIQ58191.1 MAG: flagellar hook-basal body complex protein FliE [Bdellovibrio sp. CG12_big_fil_rev_8_21_14_0_65_39_13]PIR34353.1 MAG: flagellar hook-basal body complex protein FliE [Bdellovibrio sp. CG11_big_fil_rev_8_21_14_0_20_39_38]PJB54421.1 MAG: flagellar hook-basal body complex protein FliE [Bdellovibrio sp. CG_4_9_14_3_um_filter_39_7]